MNKALYWIANRITGGAVDQLAAARAEIKALEGKVSSLLTPDEKDREIKELSAMCRKLRSDLDLSESRRVRETKERTIIQQREDAQIAYVACAATGHGKLAESLRVALLHSGTLADRMDFALRNARNPNPQTHIGKNVSFTIVDPAFSPDRIKKGHKK